MTLNWSVHQVKLGDQQKKEMANTQHRHAMQRVRRVCVIENEAEKC